MFDRLMHELVTVLLYVANNGLAELFLLYRIGIPEHGIAKREI